MSGKAVVDGIFDLLSSLSQVHVFLSDFLLLFLVCIWVLTWGGMLNAGVGL